MRNIAVNQDPAVAAVETREWQESLDYVVQKGGGVSRAAELLRQLEFHARQSGYRLPFSANTPYINTISPSQQPPFPGNQALERRVKSLVRWNALSMVVRANKLSDGIGGHISTFASAATLYEIGFNHFFKGRGAGYDGDVIFFQGHAAPGIYSRAFLEGRLTVEAPRELPPRDAGGRRALVLPASLADARVLGVPDRLDGPRADHVDLPGAVHAAPGRPWPGADGEPQGLGVPRGRRDRRARDAWRHLACRARKARQPDLRHQLQPAAPRRSRSRQRSDHPGAGSRLPRRRVERHQVHLGQRLGSAVRPRHGRSAGATPWRDRRRAVPEILGRERRLHARASFRRRTSPAGARQAPERRGPPEAPARRPRSGEGLRGLQGGGRAQGAADRGAGPHRQGLRSRRSRRRQEHHAPAEEAERRRAEGVPRPLLDRNLGRAAPHLAVLPSGGRQP